MMVAGAAGTHRSHVMEVVARLVESTGGGFASPYATGGGGTVLDKAASLVWCELLPDRTGWTDPQLRGLVAGRFGQHGLLPEQIRDRLTAKPVRGLSAVW